MGVIALSDPEDHLLYTDLVVDYDLRYDLDTPSVAMQQAVHFMHKAAYTHVILQQASTISPSLPLPHLLKQWLTMLQTATHRHAGMQFFKETFCTQSTIRQTTQSLSEAYA